jgi:hypothetical protein
VPPACCRRSKWCICLLLHCCCDGIELGTTASPGSKPESDLYACTLAVSSRSSALYINTKTLLSICPARLLPPPPETSQYSPAMPFLPHMTRPLHALVNTTILGREPGPQVRRCRTSCLSSTSKYAMSTVPRCQRNTGDSHFGLA